jgi:putative endonuclease
MFYVYILLGRENRIYVGYTNDLKRRFQEHQMGKAWTTSRMLPIKLIFYEAFLSEEDARRRETYLKTSKGKSTLRLMLREYFAIQDLPTHHVRCGVPSTLHSEGYPRTM